MSNLDLLFNPLFWDKNLYRFNRAEKDMYPYSIKKEENGVVLTHNVVGIDKEDLVVKVETDENGKSKLIISGETKNEDETDKYSVHSEFLLDNKKKISDISSKLKNGLLYVTIKYEEPENLTSSKIITIE